MEKGCANYMCFNITFCHGSVAQRAKKDKTNKADRFIFLLFTATASCILTLVKFQLWLSQFSVIWNIS